MCLKCNLCVSLCVSERVKDRKRKEARKEGRISCRICKAGSLGGQVIHHVQACWSDGVCSVGCLAASMALVCWQPVAPRLRATPVAPHCDNQRCLQTLANTLGREASYSWMRTTGVEEQAVEKTTHIGERREKTIQNGLRQKESLGCRTWITVPPLYRRDVVSSNTKMREKKRIGMLGNLHLGVGEWSEKPQNDFRSLCELRR